MKCCCPFHQENHASFIYNPKTWSFRCFGACGRSYDLIDVLMYKGMTFAESCKKLFELANMKYSFGELGVKTKSSYRYPTPVECTDKSKVYKYLERRKISPKTVDYADVRQDDEGNIVFNYYDTNDVLTMVKYRPSRKVKKGENKNWCQKDADTAPLLFNMNRVNTTMPLLVAEGECFPPDAEILTKNGWVCFSDYVGQEVAQVDENLNASFTTPKAIIHKLFDGDMISHRSGGNYASITTAKHNIVYVDYKEQIVKRPADEMPRSIGSGYIPTTVHMDGPGIPLTNDQIALYLAVSADCTIDVRNTGHRHSRFGVKKMRKFHRLRGILDRLGIEYFERNKPNSKNYVYLGFCTPEWIKSKLLPTSWIYEATEAQREFILSEMAYWDGNSVVNRNQTEYSTKHYSNAVLMQTIAHTSGRMSTIVKRHNEHGEWYSVHILHSKHGVSCQRGFGSKSHYSGDVYCVSVDTGMILVRQEGHITVTGNCDCLSAIECGFTNAVSVPLGAGNLHWIEENWDWLEQFSSIIICSDNDEAGEKMRKEAAYRLGSWRTKIVSIPPIYEDENGKRFSVNDLNESLFYFGKERTLQFIQSAKDTPIPGVIDFADIEDVDLDQMDGLPTGIPELDKYLMKLFYGTLTILTGVNGCVSADTEYFNGHCWKPISEYTDGEKVLQYNADGTAELVIPEKYHKYPCDHFWHLHSYTGVDQMVSDEHNLVVRDWYRGELKKRNALNFVNEHNSSVAGIPDVFITSFSYNNHVGDGVTDKEFDAIIRSVLDDSISEKEKWFLCSTKQLNTIWKKVIEAGQLLFTTKSKEIADYLQFCGCASGKAVCLTRIGGSYCVFSDNKTISSLRDDCKPKQIEKCESEDGYKYCFTVPSGMLVLRHNNVINVTGNSGKSSIINQIIAECLDANETAFLYSGELPNFQSKSWLNFILAGQRSLTEHTNSKGSVYYKITPEAKKQIADYYRGRLFIRKDGESNAKSEILKTMEDAIRKYGVKLLVIDNMTSLNLECSDDNKYEKQAELITQLIYLAVKYNVAIILVVHPHKIETMRRLNKMDVQGKSAIIDLAHRILSLYRVQEKDKQGTPRQNGKGWVTPPVKADVVIDILKDRMTGYENQSVNVFYDRPSRRFFRTEEELAHQYNWDKRQIKSPLPFPPPQIHNEDEIFGTLPEEKNEYGR